VTLKKPHAISKMDQAEASLLEEDLRVLYEHKLESVACTVSASENTMIYQRQEIGENNFSATGSPIVSRTFAFQSTFDQVIYATAHAMSTDITAHVTDVTASSITVAIRDADGTDNICAITTGTIMICFQVVGSNP